LSSFRTGVCVFPDAYHGTPLISFSQGVEAAHILAAQRAEIAKTNPEAARESDALHKRLMRRE
jgi:hypothetical protein